MQIFTPQLSLLIHQASHNLHEVFDDDAQLATHHVHSHHTASHTHGTHNHLFLDFLKLINNKTKPVKGNQSSKKIVKGIYLVVKNDFKLQSSFEQLTTNFYYGLKLQSGFNSILVPPPKV